VSTTRFRLRPRQCWNLSNPICSPPSADCTDWASSEQAGRLFRGRNGGYVRDEKYLAAWHAARRRCVTEGVVRPDAIPRPYDLRHSALSVWLAAGVDASQIAAWAGHSKAVPFRLYAHVISAKENGNTQRIENVYDRSVFRYPRTRSDRPIELGFGGSKTSTTNLCSGTRGQERISRSS
jgi:integrase